MMADLTVINNSTSLLPMNLIDKAVTNGADLANIEKLMELQDKWESKQAKKSFYEALAKFQKECPTLTKTKKGHNYMYAPLGDIVAQIKDVLFNNGLSFRFEQNHNDGITVTCIVSHLDGHSEKTTMTALADKSGSKNDVQAIGSTVTYLQRYTLIGALGISTADEGMDARLPDETKQTDPEYSNLLIQLAEQSAQTGTASYQLYWESLTNKQKKIIGNEEKSRIYKIAKAVDDGTAQWWMV